MMGPQAHSEPTPLEDNQVGRLIAISQFLQEHEMFTSYGVEKTVYLERLPGDWYSLTVDNHEGRTLKSFLFKAIQHRELATVLKGNI